MCYEESTDGSFSAYLPDLPGCVACGDTRDEAQRLIEEAVLLHLESMSEHAEPIPTPSTTAAVVHAMCIKE